MHDTVDLEERGIPTVFVASEPFADAARAQAKALGADPLGVFVPHPIQDRTDGEVQAIAESTVERLLAGLTKTM